MKAIKTPWCKYEFGTDGYRSKLVWMCYSELHDLFALPANPVKAVRLVLCNRPSKYTQTVTLCKNRWLQTEAVLKDGTVIGLDSSLACFLRRAGLANKTIHFRCEWR
jgi:hypothetical protein